MTPLRYRLARILYSAAESLDSPHNRAVRAARDRELLRRALIREAHQSFGDECEAALAERDAEPVKVAPINRRKALKAVP